MSKNKYESLMNSDTDSDSESDSVKDFESELSEVEDIQPSTLLDMGKQISEIKYDPMKMFDPKIDHEPDSYKRVLCFNILNRGLCSYGDKCVYAHHLKEQTVDSPRKEAYDIINSDTDLSNLNLTNNKQLYYTLRQLTNLCPPCAKGYCPGGYNCKYGAFCKQSQICRRDFLDGNCHEVCDMVHLTNRGFIPYHAQINSQRVLTYADKVRSSSSKVMRRIPILKPMAKEHFIKSKRVFHPPVKGIHLTDNYFRKNPQRLTEDTDSDISMSDDEIEKVKKFLLDDEELESVNDIFRLLNL